MPSSISRVTTFTHCNTCLMQIQNNMDYIAKNVGVSGQLAGAVQSIPQETGRMAMVVVATVPIAILYPFFQRYFVKGLTIGGVKE